VDLDAVPKNRVPDWIEGHEHAPDELVVVEEDTHSHESGGRGKAHGDRCRPAQGGADWTTGRGTAGAVGCSVSGVLGTGQQGHCLAEGARVLRAGAPGRRGVDGREQDGRGCRWGRRRLSAGVAAVGSLQARRRGSIRRAGAREGEEVVVADVAELAAIHSRPHGEAAEVECGVAGEVAVVELRRGQVVERDAAERGEGERVVAELRQGRVGVGTAACAGRRCRALGAAPGARARRAASGARGRSRAERWPERLAARLRPGAVAAGAASGHRACWRLREMGRRLGADGGREAGGSWRGCESVGRRARGRLGAGRGFCAGAAGCGLGAGQGLPGAGTAGRWRRPRREGGGRRNQGATAVQGRMGRRLQGWRGKKL
jgi:hypothetical protein